MGGMLGVHFQRAQEMAKSFPVTYIKGVVSMGKGLIDSCDLLGSCRLLDIFGQQISTFLCNLFYFQNKHIP